MSGSIQSSDFVPGVSGWKIDTKTGEFEMHCAALSVVGKDEAARYGGAAVTHSPKRSIVIDGVTYISEAFVKEASVEDKVSAQYTARTALLNESVRGDDHGSLAEAIKAWETGAALKAGGVASMLDRLTIQIDETELGKVLKEQIDSLGVGQVNKRLDELKEKQGAENRAVAERLDTLATMLAAQQSQLTQAKDSAPAQAKREVAEALLRDLEADKSGGTLGDCKHRFGAGSSPFGGWHGTPIKS